MSSQQNVVTPVTPYYNFLHLQSTIHSSSYIKKMEKQDLQSEFGKMIVNSNPKKIPHDQKI